MLLNKKRKRPQNLKLRRYYLNQAPFESVNPDEFDPQNYLDSQTASHSVIVHYADPLAEVVPHAAFLVVPEFLISILHIMIIMVIILHLMMILVIILLMITIVIILHLIMIMFLMLHLMILIMISPIMINSSSLTPSHVGIFCLFLQASFTIGSSLVCLGSFLPALLFFPT
jgi:hypothetical protein